MKIIKQLSIRIVSLDEQKLVRGRYSDDSRSVLVRPDRYIFGHTDDELDSDSLINRLAEELLLI